MQSSQVNTLVPLARRPIPRLPVFGWESFSGAKRSSSPCLLDAPRLTFTTSGRASIYLALKLLGISEGKSVLVPTYHCPTMVTPIIALGGKPIFCPIDGTGQIAVEATSDLATPETRAIIAPHYFGLPHAMELLRAWCDKSGIALIEDCAHALFGNAGDRPIGQWGDIAVASLTKFLPVPEGGCLVCNKDKNIPLTLFSQDMSNQVRAVLDILEEGARHRAVPGINGILEMLFALKQRFREVVAPSRKPAREIMDIERFPDAFDPALASTRMTRASRWVANLATRERIVANRRRNYAHLAQSLVGSSHFRPLRPHLPDAAAPYVFPLWVDRPDPAYQTLRERGIPLFRWDRLWPGTPTIQYDRGKEWSHHVFQLVCHQDLQRKELDCIVDDLWELCR